MYKLVLTALLISSIVSLAFLKFPIAPALLAVALLVGMIRLFRPLYLTLGSHAAQEHQDRGEGPPSYPNGWFQVMLSRELKVGQRKPIKILGKDLVAYRGDDGAVRIVQRYCPHNGADLGRGTVCEGNIKCPFHGWEFGDEGLAKIPYREDKTKKLPQIKLAGYQVCEKADTIFLWHHADGLAPQWELDPLGADRHFYFYGRTLHLTRCSHCMEPQENQADYGHFFQVHKSQGLVQIGWTMRDYRIEGHQAVFTVDAEYKLFGIKLIQAEIVSAMQGPGLTRVTTVSSYLYGLIKSRMVTLAMVTPITAFQQHLAFHHYGRSLLNFPIAHLFQILVSIEVEKDMSLMATKQYRLKPKYIKEEQALIAYRNFYEQFLPENG